MSHAQQLVQKEIEDNFIMVFSKSYCPVSEKVPPCGWILELSGGYLDFRLTTRVLFKIYTSTLLPPRNFFPSSNHLWKMEKATGSSSKFRLSILVVLCLAWGVISVAWTKETMALIFSNTSPKNMAKRLSRRFLSIRWALSVSLL